MYDKTDLDLLIALAERIQRRRGGANPLDGRTFPPIFSFEGLAGSGKTTQIRLVAERLKEEFEEPGYLELPENSGASKVLRALYKDQAGFRQLEPQVPWLNPLFILVDLYVAVTKLQEQGYPFLLMSRGIFSTLYYNWEPFVQAGLEREDAWQQISEICSDFIRPTAVVFLDVPIEVAFTRIEARNRLPRRESDSIPGLERSRTAFHNLFERFQNEIPVHHVNGVGTTEAVTERIVSVLRPYLTGRPSR